MIKTATARGVRIAAVAAGLLLVLSACGGGSTTADDPWQRIEDPRAGVTFLAPDAWNRAVETLAPAPSGLRELVSLGTHPMRPGSSPDCPELPGHALNDMTELDAFITLQEILPDDESFARTLDLPPRPGDFEFPPEVAGIGGSCSDNDGIQTWWFPFRDSGRAFYLQVAIGKSASEDTRRQVSGILRSIAFEPAAGDMGVVTRP